MDFQSCTIYEQRLHTINWMELKEIFDDCFPLPPRDVFNKAVNLALTPPRIWVAKQDHTTVGCCMFIPHSKGGHIENLAVLSTYQGNRIGSCLVNSILHSLPPDQHYVITATSRAALFYESLGFSQYSTLDDGSSIFIMMYTPART